MQKYRFCGIAAKKKVKISSCRANKMRQTLVIIMFLHDLLFRLILNKRFANEIKTNNLCLIKNTINFVSNKIGQ